MNKRVYLPLFRGGAFILLFVMIVLSFVGCGLKDTKPTEVVFMGCYSDLDEISIELADYDLKTESQNYRFKIINDTDWKFLYGDSFTVWKKDGESWNLYNNGPTVETLKHIEPHSESIFSMHDSENEKFNLQIKEKGTYKIQFNMAQVCAKKAFGIDLWMVLELR